MQYLKAMKARLQKGNHRRVFVVLFKGANRLYEEAISSLKKCSVELPNVLQHLNAMKELCYIQALYYEVYMSKEDLNDVEVHGTGKASICLQLFMVGLNELDGEIFKIILSHRFYYDLIFKNDFNILTTF